MPTCLVVQHIAPESAFSIADALEAADVAVDVRKVFEGDPVPERSDGFDGLVVMGGPMSANSDDGFPSRKTELELLADAVERAVPTVGVCLGAQLLAMAAGGAVHRGAGGPEIGWGPVHLLSATAGDRLFDGLPGSLTVMHWHGDTYDMPAGAECLLSNRRYANQGFRVGPAAWGVQFHLEVTAAAVEGFLEAFPHEAEEATGGAAGIRSTSSGALGELARWSGVVFTRFATLVVERSDQIDLVDLI